MANLKSSKKDILRIARNRSRRKPYLTMVRHILSDARNCLTECSSNPSDENEKKLISFILKFEKFGNKAASKGVFKRKSVLNKLRRLNERKRKIFPKN